MRFALFLWLAMAMGTAVLADDFPSSPDDILGVWETAHDDESWSRIEIYKADGLYHGRIIYLSSPVYPDDGSEGPAGRPRTDRNNPDESLHDRPILGLEFMHSFRFDDGKWRDGRIYDPKNGKEYRCKLTLKGLDDLEVFGYKKVGFFKLGRNTAWTRHTPD